MNLKYIFLTLLLIVLGQKLYSQELLLKGKQRKAQDALGPFFSGDGDSSKAFFEEERVIYKIDQKGNKLTASYYKTDDPTNHKKDSLFIPFKSFVAISEWKRGLEASIINIPFKIRPKMDTIPSVSIADVKNIGLFLGFSNVSDRYFYNGKSSKHKFTLGGFVAPSIISLNSSNTKGRFDGDISQLGLSLGGGINYTYKSISFILIPVGFDFGLNSQAKDWIYHKKYWLGFGIGIDATLLSF